MSKHERNLHKLIQSITTNTFDISKTKNGHLRICIEGASRLLFTGSTPSDHRGIKNLTRDIKQAIA